MTPAGREQAAIRRWAEKWRRANQAYIDMYGPGCTVRGEHVASCIATLDIVIGFLRHRARSQQVKP